MFIILTSKKNEKIAINTKHVVLIGETSKGLYVLMDNEEDFYFKESLSDVLKNSDFLNTFVEN